ncbi:MAG TPA: hypothetical protein IGS53_25280 [Leptolyngbyaceae cyanobacterium M33_DOE_097]|uniref:Uncharacterized protein n=1 Tax=Oscillatoriales cyanobacterium SpSt-418 TaxID=2282169 RepID=A0A7C3KKF0_9CYAN|nr:hypothetical protein [Leptolyngbyaceae cyanobacterium M33_DOE_097]
MQTEAQRALYWELEQITESVSKSEPNSLKNWLNGIWQVIVNVMTTSDEPKIWTSTDWFGHIWWNVYFPRTGQTVRLNSEEEVRIWLEEHLHLL